jgi:hypothetical protein
MTILDSSPRLNGARIGWALSVVLVALVLACAVAALFWPSSAFGQGWTAVFGPGDSLPNIMEIVIGSVAVAWLMTLAFLGARKRWSRAAK